MNTLCLVRLPHLEGRESKGRCMAFIWLMGLVRATKPKCWNNFQPGDREQEQEREQGPGSNVFKYQSEEEKEGKNEKIRGKRKKENTMKKDAIS